MCLRENSLYSVVDATRRESSTLHDTNNVSKYVYSLLIGNPKEDPCVTVLRFEIIYSEKLSFLFYETKIKKGEKRVRFIFVDGAQYLLTACSKFKYLTSELIIKRDFCTVI